MLWIHERVCDISRHYSALIQYETNSQQLLQESGRCNLCEKTSLLGLTCTSQNNVMLMMTPPWLRYFLVSFNLQSCCLMQSVVCSLQSANVIHRYFAVCDFLHHKSHSLHKKYQFKERLESIKLHINTFLYLFPAYLFTDLFRW